MAADDRQPVDVSRRSALAQLLSLPLALAMLRWQANAAMAHQQQPKPGINLAGAEFGRVPGRIDQDYSYPTAANLAYFASIGMKLVRIPFKWERIQPEPFGRLDRAELARLTHCVRAARNRDFIVVLDLHNYAKRSVPADAWRKQHVIGSARLTRKSFADVWARLARAFADDSGIWFGLMNEPNDITLKNWLAAANGAIAAIRAEKAQNLVLVPGINWSGAHSWQASGNEAMANIRDSANNFAFEVHQYFDANASGTSATAVSETIGSERVAGFTEWARRQRFRAFLGEFGIADNPVALAAGRDLLAALARAPDVWIGWAAWAGGPRWPEDSLFLLEPRPDGSMRAATRVLMEAARR